MDNQQTTESFFGDGAGLDALVEGATDDLASAAGEAPVPDEAADGLSVPGGGDDAVPSLAGDDTTPGSTVDDELAERERRLAEREREIAAAESDRERAQAAGAWKQAWDRGMSWFGQAEQSVWRNAENAVDPEGYVREQLARLNNQRTQWIAEYYQNLDTTRQEQYARSRIPEYAAYLVETLSLPQDDLKRLMRYQDDPDQMQRIANDLRDIRQTQKTLAAEKRSKNSPLSGSGGQAGARKAPRTLDELVDMIVT